MGRSYLVAERHEIAEGIDGFLAQSEVGRAAAIALVDLVDVELLDFG